MAAVSFSGVTKQHKGDGPSAVQSLDLLIEVPPGDRDIAIDPKAIDRYPKVAERIGTSVIVGFRPEHFVMDGDPDLPDDQKLTLVVDLAEAMGAEVHVHATLDVPPVELEGAPVTADDGEEVSSSVTRLIARVEGIHAVRAGDDVTLGIKTHLAHFFDPATGDPLR